MIQSAKNVFSGGLVMDFAPDNTSSDTLTSALNATLTTFNGNEMALLNDMGNARVETAYLPEGYVPVGTCEFGDIIYIVSYNPLTDKSLIGCFPSPERNITSEELSEPNVTISNDLFLEEVKPGFGQSLIKTTSAKYVLMNKNLNPGDKYIIYTSDRGGLFNESSITDVGNTDHSYGKFPKLLKIHVISIDSSNKVDYLDSNITWYDKVGDKDYFINERTNEAENKPNIDSYRNVLQSGYSVFLSKVSGKLALLIELELIDTFSCTYNIYKKNKEIVNSTPDTIEYQNYDVYFNVSWKTSNENINPSGICLYKQSWTGVNPDFAGKAIFWQSEGNKYVLNKKNSETSNVLTVSLGVTSANEAYFWNECYKADLSRCYKQESNISYTDFKLSKSYDKILEKCLQYIKYTLYLGAAPGNLEANGSILIGNKSLEPRADWETIDTSELSLNNIVINRTNGIPIEGLYYVNAHFIHDGSLYTAYKEKDIKIYPYLIKDDIVNNYFRYPISKKFGTIRIPTKLKFSNINGEEVSLIPDISNLVYNYEVAPVMPYGIIPHLISKGTINFSKIGSGEINLTKWKYYNTANTSTLTVGFDIFPEENMGVAGITMEFMDNLGLAAIYEFDKNSSYSGTFTDQIPLNGSFANYRFKLTGIHAGLLDVNGEVYLPEAPEAIKAIPSLSPNGCKIITNKEPIAWNGATTRHLNDFGTIYSNFLYLVKITVKYCYKNALGQYDDSDNTNFKSFYRWYWTNDLYNDNFYSQDDFDTLPLNLNLDLLATYNTANYKATTLEFNTKVPSIENPSDNVGTILQNINTNILSNLTLGLLDTHLTFSLNESIKDQIKVEAYIGNKGIIHNSSEITSVNGKYTIDEPILHAEKVPSLEKDPTTLLNGDFTKEVCSQLYNWHNLDNASAIPNTEELEYIDYLQNVVKITPTHKIDIHNLTTTFKYKLANFDNNYKIYKPITLTLPVFTPLIHNRETAEYYGVSFPMSDKGSPRIENIINVGACDYKSGKPRAYAKFTCQNFNSATGNYLRYAELSSDVDDRCNFDLLNYFSDDPDNIKRLPLNDRGFFAIRFYDRHYNTHGRLGVIMGGTRDARIASLLGNSILTPGVSWSSYSLMIYEYDDISKRGFYTLWFGDGEDFIIQNRRYMAKIFSYNAYSNKSPVFYCFHVKDKGFYLVNTFELSDGLGETSQNVDILGDKMGRKLISLLSQLWVKSLKSDIISTIKLDDIVHLTPHETLYYLDILYKTKLLQQDNAYLNILGIKYANYLKALLIQHDNIVINKTNVDVNIANVLKNCPVVFQIKSKLPSILNIANREPNALIKKIGEVDYLPIYLKELIENLLYYENKNEFMPYYGGMLSIKEMDKVTLDNKTNILTVSYSTNTLEVDLNPGFEYVPEKGLLPRPNNDTKMDIFTSCFPEGTTSGSAYDGVHFEGVTFKNVYSNIKLFENGVYFT